MEPNCVPPVMPTAASTASTAVRRPRSNIISWVMMETEAGSSRLERPSREPEVATASSGREKFASLSAVTSNFSSWMGAVAAAAVAGALPARREPGARVRRASSPAATAR
jgi:hypothetical protein